LLGVAGYFALLYANAVDKSNLSHIIHRWWASASAAR